MVAAEPVRQELRKATARRAYLTECATHTSKYTAATATLDLIANSSDEEGTATTGKSAADEYKLHLKMLYAITVGRVSETVLAKNNQQECEEGRETQARDKILEAGPAAIFKIAIEAEIQERLRKAAAKPRAKSKPVTNAPLPDGYGYTKLAADTMLGGAKPNNTEGYSVPKNGYSPATRAGAQSDKFTKNKGKGKGH